MIQTHNESLAGSFLMLWTVCCPMGCVCLSEQAGFVSSWVVTGICPFCHWAHTQPFNFCVVCNLISSTLAVSGALWPKLVTCSTHMIVRTNLIILHLMFRFLGSTKIALRDLSSGQVRSLPSRNVPLVNESGQNIGVSLTHTGNCKTISFLKNQWQYIQPLYFRLQSTLWLAMILQPMPHQTSTTLKQEMLQLMLVLSSTLKMRHCSGQKVLCQVFNLGSVYLILDHFSFFCWLGVGEEGDTTLPDGAQSGSTGSPSSPTQPASLRKRLARAQNRHRLVDKPQDFQVSLTVFAEESCSFYQHQRLSETKF